MTDHKGKKTGGFLTITLFVAAFTIALFPSALRAIEVNDNTITWEVMSELIEEESVSLHFIDVGVNKGIVTLTGSVDNLLAKQRATEIPVAERLFPEMEPPRIQVVLLDPEEDKVAFRRVSDPLQGERKSDWYVGELDEVIDDALSWVVELEETEDLIKENLNEEFEG